jgi:PAS domain S-box-containing protein
MKLDYITLFAIMGFIDIIIVITLLYYITVVRSRKWFITTYLGYKLFETLALISFGLRGIASDFITIQFANSLLFISVFLHLVSVLSYTEKIKRKLLYGLGILTVVSIVFLFVLYDFPRIRVGLSSFSIAILFFTGGITLYTNRQSFKFPILLSTGFIFYATINMFRGISVLYNSGAYSFYDLTTWDSILVLSGIATILINSFGFLLLLKEVDEKTISRQNHITSIAFNESPVSIVLTDKEGNIEFVNPKFSELTGYSYEESRGKNTSILKTELTPDITYESLWRTIQAGKTWSGEFVNRKKNGDVYYEEAVIAPIKNEKQEIINHLAIKIDITKRKASESLLEQRNQELSEINHTKDRLFSIIGHDLKGPMGNLKQLLEFINQDIEKGDKESVQKIVKMSKETAETSFQFLENLLNWSRSQLNVIEPQKEKFNLATVIHEVCELYKSSIQQKKQQLVYKNGVAYELVADKEMISAVVRNLVSNSIKFTPVYGSIKIDLEEKEEDVVLSIKDSGVGIEKKRQEKLFKFTENQSTHGTAGEKGTGIGLVLCKEFVTKNKGKIWVESELNDGCTFNVSLPK